MPKSMNSLLAPEGNIYFFFNRISSAIWDWKYYKKTAVSIGLK